ncbi:MAG TPA: hypothetical protein VF796_24230 [Humisphaera sp.]
MKALVRTVSVAVLLLCAAVVASAAAEPAPPSQPPATRPARDLRDVVGVAHAGGKYPLTDGDYLNEGADVVLATGSRVIKVWFTPRPARDYPFNSRWPARVDSLVDLARTEHFRALFAKPFTTFVLDAFAPRRPDHYYRDGMTPADAARERRAMADLAAHLLETYQGTGKTFVIQNWEGDWSLRGGAPGTDPTDAQVRGMTDWLNARQDGVADARTAAEARGVRGVTVLHAAEVNHVARAMRGERTVTNDVLPHTRCDLYSYSAYDVPTDDPAKFRAALDYLAAKAPKPPGREGRHVYVGEYGFPERAVGGPEAQLAKVRSATRTAIDWGAPYVLYWQVYCNEPVRPFDGRPAVEDMKGFWLVRPDGSRPPVTDWLKETLTAPATRPGG